MKKAFSLVELIVVVAVVLILTGIGAVSINSFTQTKKIELVTSELSTQIRLARNLAATEQLPNGSTGGLSFVAVNVSSDFTVTAVGWRKESGGTLTNLNSYFSKKIDSANGLTVASSLADFGFSASSGRLVGVSDGGFINGPVTLTVSDGTSSNNRTITINNLGLIDD